MAQLYGYRRTEFRPDLRGEPGSGFDWTICGRWREILVTSDQLAENAASPTKVRLARFTRSALRRPDSIENFSIVFPEQVYRCGTRVTVQKEFRHQTV